MRRSLPGLDGHQSTFSKFTFEFVQYLLHQLYKSAAAETLNPHANDRRNSGTRDRQKCVEICIERDALIKEQTEWHHRQSGRVTFRCSILEIGRCKRKCLLNVIGFEVWVVAQKVFPVGIRCHSLYDSSNCESHSANTRLAVHLVGVPCNSIKTGHTLFSSILAVQLRCRFRTGTNPLHCAGQGPTREA